MSFVKVLTAKAFRNFAAGGLARLPSCLLYTASVSPRETERRETERRQAERRETETDDGGYPILKPYLLQHTTPKTA
jgi:hypothetical protein